METTVRPHPAQRPSKAGEWVVNLLPFGQGLHRWVSASCSDRSMHGGSLLLRPCLSPTGPVGPIRSNPESGR